jgi:hypothetical protein
VPRPLSEPKRQAILADIEAGQKSRNQIARDHKVSVSSVTKLAPTDAFDRSKMKKALAARQIDHKARLSELAGRAAGLAERALSSFETMTDEEWARTSFHSRGIVFGIAADKARELAPEDSAAEEISSLLGGLLGQLKGKHGDAPPE